MGTNYYLIRKVCAHCGRGDAPLHIGKSSAGWCFGLRVYPEEGINDLPDWQRIFGEPGVSIQDEYDQPVTVGCMIKVISEREWKSKDGWTEKALRDNHAERGPNGLARHEANPPGSRFEVRHGAGTYDLCNYEFS